MRLNVPNIISLFRIAAAPFLIVCGRYGADAAFIALFVLLMVSDVLDGFAARTLHEVTPEGARLDSIGDTLTYLAAAAGFWLLWPGIVERELFYILVVIALYLLPGVVSLYRFGCLVSYHTWLTKLTAVLMAAGIFFLAADDWPVPFHIAVFFVLLEVVENIYITLHLDAPRIDLRGWWEV